MKKAKPAQPGLDNRYRDQDGRIRAKNGATKLSTLRNTYGDDFAAEYRSDMKLDTLLDRTGADSLSDLLKKQGS